MDTHFASWVSGRSLTRAWSNMGNLGDIVIAGKSRPPHNYSVDYYIYP